MTNSPQKQIIVRVHTTAVDDQLSGDFTVNLSRSESPAVSSPRDTQCNTLSARDLWIIQGFNLRVHERAGYVKAIPMLFRLVKQQL